MPGKGLAWLTLADWTCLAGLLVGNQAMTNTQANLQCFVAVTDVVTCAITGAVVAATVVLALPL